eukprot:scaffold532_cov216-Ochromonas_danica.AAC.5
MPMGHPRCLNVKSNLKSYNQDAVRSGLKEAGIYSVDAETLLSKNPFFKSLDQQLRAEQTRPWHS